MKKLNKTNLKKKDTIEAYGKNRCSCTCSCIVEDHVNMGARIDSKQLMK